MIKNNIETTIGKVINLNEVNKEEYKFMMKVLPIIKNGEQRHYIFIV